MFLKIINIASRNVTLTLEHDKFKTTNYTINLLLISLAQLEIASELILCIFIMFHQFSNHD